MSNKVYTEDSIQSLTPWTLSVNTINYFLYNNRK